MADGGIQLCEALGTALATDEIYSVSFLFSQNNPVFYSNKAHKNFMEDLIMNKYTFYVNGGTVIITASSQKEAWEIYIENYVE